MEGQFGSDFLKRLLPMSGKKQNAANATDTGEI